MYFLVALIFFSATLLIRADYKKKNAQKYFFKPLTTVLIILFAWLQVPEISLKYKYCILIGLFFSLVGDIFLMLPSDKFISGLASFLVAHIFFLVAFVSDSGWYLDFILFIPILLYLIILLKVLFPHTGNKTIPVLFYGLTLMLLLWQSAGRNYNSFTHSSLMALIGTIIFSLSDSTLAFNRFVKEFKLAQFLILSTYYFAQVFIASSI